MVKIARFGRQEIALFVVIVAMIIVFTVLNSSFLTASNFETIGVEGAVLMIVSVGECMLVLMAVVDLSVGSILALGAVVAATLIAFDHVNPFEAALAAVAVSGLAGLLNGLLVSYLEWSPIVVTLGTLLAYRGVAELVTSATPSGLGGSFDYLGTGYVFGIPFAPVAALGILVLGIVYLHMSAIGRHTYAIGGKKRAAYLAGINVKQVPLLWYVITGMLAGFGGLITAARLDSAPPGTLASSFELSVLTAVLLGGIAFEGGRGSLFGVLLGVAFLEILTNGLTIVNVPFYYQELAEGASLVLAAGVNHLSSGNGLRLGGIKGNKTGRAGERQDIADLGAMDKSSRSEGIPDKQPEVNVTNEPR